MLLPLLWWQKLTARSGPMLPDSMQAVIRLVDHRKRASNRTRFTKIHRVVAQRVVENLGMLNQFDIGRLQVVSSVQFIQNLAFN